MNEGDRVVLVGEDVAGTITKKFPKAEGPWAEQYYEVDLDDTPDWYLVTLGEHALVAEV